MEEDGMLARCTAYKRQPRQQQGDPERMPVSELHHVIRDTYVHIMRRHGSTAVAFKECVRLALQHQPEWTEKDARMAVARMIAEEPRDEPR